MREKPSAHRLPCACANLRRAARAVTQIYDEELRAAGLRATQLTLLQALDEAGTLTQGELGALLCLDSTTLTRSLRPLVENRWVNVSRGADRRERHLHLTAEGHAKVRNANAAWQRAQNRVKKAVGPAWEDLEKTLRLIAGAAL